MAHVAGQFDKAKTEQATDEDRPCEALPNPLLAADEHSLGLHLVNQSGTHGTKPVVVIGNGPVGIRITRELRQRLPDVSLIVYGREAHQPYDRVRLSQWLTGEVEVEELHSPQSLPEDADLEQRIGFAITGIDPALKLVFDQSGRAQPYSKLIIATGSRPHIPALPGNDLSGVYTFRDLDDTTSLIARRTRSRHTVVLGGGLLGLEAARGMQRHNTQVTIIEHADRLLGRQLDEEASQTLEHTINQFGIDTIIGDGVAQILDKDSKVSGVQLRSGRVLDCDTVILSTGIQPNLDLAMEARLALGRGIRVDDNMRTSQDDIYAVGECAEHRGHVYGLVAPGYEQASVAAAHIAGMTGSYPGSIAASRLKVVGSHVFSMGPMGMEASRGYGKTYVYRDAESGIYRKILVHRHKLEGAIGIGEWVDTLRMQGAITRKDRILPWQIWRFLQTGSIWLEDDQSEVAQWPATAVVCQCTGVTRGQIGTAILQGAKTQPEVSQCTGASTVCGACKPLVEELLGHQQQPEPTAGHGLMLGSAIFTVLAGLAFFLLPALPYPDSVQVSWRWDNLWRDGLFKQISGFSILGLFAVGLLVSPRKRMKQFQNLGSFDTWRWVHIGLGVLVVLTLLVHTGMSLGSGLNFLLMTSFSALLLLGGLATGVIATEHKLGRSLAMRLRKQSIWMHILLFWPVPVLLGFHIFKGYWF